MRLPGIWLALLFSYTGYSQPAGNSISQPVDSLEATFWQDYEITMVQVASIEASIRAGGVKENIRELLRLYNIAITTNRYFFHPQICRQFLEKTASLLSQSKDLLGDEHAEFLRLLKTQQAGFYFDIDDYPNAYRLYEENLEAYLKLPRTHENCKSLFQIAQYMAMILERQGEVEGAINQYLTSIDYYTCSVKRLDVQNYTLVFRNIGKAYLRKGDSKTALIYFKQAEDSLKVAWGKSTTKGAHANAAITLFEMQAQYYLQKNAFDSASLMVRKAEPFLSYSEPFRGRYHLILAKAQHGAGRLDLARENYDKAISLVAQRGEKGVLLSEAYLSMGKLFADQHDVSQAMQFFTKAMTALVLDYKPDANGNPLPSDVLSNKHLFNALVEKYKLLENEFIRNNDLNLLEQAYATHSASIALLDSLGNAFSTDVDKVILAEQSFPVYEDGIRLAYALYQRTNDTRYLTHCYMLIDKSKGLLLLEKVRAANKFAGVNQNWLNQERDLHSEMLIMEQELFNLASQPDKKDQSLEVRERYAKLKRSYSDLIKQIQVASPAYYKLRFDHSVINPEIIQKDLLQKGEILVEYFIGEKELFVFAISENNVYSKQKKLPAGFADKVMAFRNALIRPNEMLPSADLLSTANELFSFLLQDVLEQAGEATALTIIPDGVLSFIPFEILTTQQSDEPHYLLNRYTIRYAFSASYLKEQMMAKAKSPKNFFAGFASSGGGVSESARNTLKALQYAQQEIKQIAEVLGSGYNLYEEATKSDFLEHAGDYRILHLAMHSLVNHNNPMFSSMVFASSENEGERETELFAIELYGMQLNSELAVLSACETGVGTMHRGEGIMSFSRAFAYAGVPAAVISLWKVPDKATSLIMVKFYEFLSKGHTKDEALRLAKTEFIHQYPQMSHPFYWSGFVLTGNNHEIQVASKSWIAWVVGIAVTVLLIVLYWKFRIRLFSKSG